MLCGHLARIEGSTLINPDSHALAVAIGAPTSPSMFSASTPTSHLPKRPAPALCGSVDLLTLDREDRIALLRDIQEGRPAPRVMVQVPRLAVVRTQLSEI